MQLCNGRLQVADQFELHRFQPHAAGGRPIGSGDLIAENVRHFLAGEPLRNVVAR